MNATTAQRNLLAAETRLFKVLPYACHALHKEKCPAMQAYQNALNAGCNNPFVLVEMATRNCQPFSCPNRIQGN